MVAGRKKGNYLHDYKIEVRSWLLESISVSAETD
jgi:hypothetical protein